MSTNEWLRLPGLFRRWEFEQVIEPGDDFHVEEAGHAEDGSQLFVAPQNTAQTNYSQAPERLTFNVVSA